MTDPRPGWTKIEMEVRDEWIKGLIADAQTIVNYMTTTGSTDKVANAARRLYDFVERLDASQGIPRV